MDRPQFVLLPVALWIISILHYVVFMRQKCPVAYPVLEGHNWDPRDSELLTKQCICELALSCPRQGSSWASRQMASKESD